VTIKLQEWIGQEIADFYIALRLKRKPQIVKKLVRNHPMRLSQMQDVGGCRVIFKDNRDLDKALDIIGRRTPHGFLRIPRTADYRDRGRPESGYRAVHLIAEREGHEIEIQVRTSVQHSWAEEVERTSIICRALLKEGEGPAELIEHFRVVSHAFHALDRGLPVNKALIQEIQSGYEQMNEIVGEGRQHLLDGFVINKGFIRSMEEQEKKSRTRRKLRNWLLIFNWNSGTFERWINVETNPTAAAQQYSNFERSRPFQDGYEVVLIGANRVAMIEQTHAHYFGINTYDQYLEQIGVVVADSSRRQRGSVSPGARVVLEKLYRKDYWGSNKRVSPDTLKNHYCHGVEGFDECMEELRVLGYLFPGPRRGPVSLNLEKKAEIEKLFD
jgi:ppGpp synthetase/RelA/SpoT-type nucleotidyltranferase